MFVNYVIDDNSYLNFLHLRFVFMSLELHTGSNTNSKLIL